MKTILTQTKKISIAAIALASLSLSATLMASEESAEESMQAKPAVIHFADRGGIRNWRAVGDDVLEIEGRNGDWFRAELFSHCQGLRTANNLGFDSEPNGDLDRYSSIYVGRGERCQFKTFERIEAPSTD